MNTLVLEVEPTAMEVEVTTDDLIVDLADGRRLIVPSGERAVQGSR